MPVQVSVGLCTGDSVLVKVGVLVGDAVLVAVLVPVFVLVAEKLGVSVGLGKAVLE